MASRPLESQSSPHSSSSSSRRNPRPKESYKPTFPLLSSAPIHEVETKTPGLPNTTTASQTIPRRLSSRIEKASSRLAPRPEPGSREQGTEQHRRGTMDNSMDLVDADGVPITYTPTTHRISKAKKGKKVHVCEFGCGKVRYSRVCNGPR